ncbi:MAG TPA: alpha/beta fold hydrolase [Polyangia bacterium]|jgi:pimeloyl-ACP methyl ester carboxylesterase|nr:alpha/beta fold hydrolase [Polyangia bacterium]
MRMRRLVRGRDVGYEDRGTGEAVVLLHPFPFGRDLWAGRGGAEDVTAALARRFRVLAIDARGFGESELGGAPYSVAELADDLAALLDALAIPRAAVLGMSMGGYTALAFAAKHAARLSALVLADTRAAADSPEVRAKREEALATIRARGPAAYLDGSLARLVSPDAPAALHAFVRARAETRADSLAAGLAALRDRPDRTAELPAIACPTLVVCGAQDLISPPAEMRGVTAAIPRARYVELPGAGHLAHLEAPEAFTAAVSQFFSEVLPS